MRLGRAAALLLATGLGSAPALAQRDHSGLSGAVAKGSLTPLSEILERLLPRLPGHRYIGAEFDPVVQIYRLKFLRDRQVLWIDVDARTGRVLRRMPS